MNRIRGRITYPPRPAPVVDDAPRKKMAAALAPKKRKSKWNDRMDGILMAEFGAKTASKLAARLGVTNNDVYWRAYKFGLQKNPTFSAAQRKWRANKAKKAVQEAMPL